MTTAFGGGGKRKAGCPWVSCRRKKKEGDLAVSFSRKRTKKIRFAPDDKKGGQASLSGEKEGKDRSAKKGRIPKLRKEEKNTIYPVGGGRKAPQPPFPHGGELLRYQPTSWEGGEEGR